jgi:hypothetical protein
MSTSDVPSADRIAGAEPPTEQLLVGEWLGLAGYLARAVSTDDVTVASARSELAAAASRAHEERALRRAASDAATVLGAESPVTTLLRAAVDDLECRDVA